MAKREEPRPEMVARMARYLGCSGTHKGPNGELMPCASHEELMRISDRAEPRKPKKKADPTKPKRKRKGRRVAGYEPLGERGVISIDTLPSGGLVSGKDALEGEPFHEFELIELKAESYTKPELRERIKKRIMAGSRGGKPGQWSARKAQLLALEYRRAGGGYRGGKRKRQSSLDKWTGEEWTTSDGKPAIREGGTNRYLPKEAWEKLSSAQRAATNRKKRRASREGRQFVANTERAREAGRNARKESKSIVYGRAKPRVGDPDVFPNADSARLRARQLGCIGISRRQTPDGETVWMPCTNMSDYRRRMGVGPQAERDRRRAERRMVGRLRRQLKKSDDCGCSGDDVLDQYAIFVEDVSEKKLGRSLRKRVGKNTRKLRRVNFDANAEDADGDGIVQEGTIHQRPAGKKPAKKPARLERETLIENFSKPGGKKKGKKRPALTNEQLNALRSQARRDAEKIPVPKVEKTKEATRVRKFFEDREKRITEKFGEVSTAEQANKALAKAFPNAEVDLNLSETLTPAERGAVHTLLDLSISHPNTSKKLDEIKAYAPGTDVSENLRKKGAAAAHRLTADLESDDSEFEIKVRQKLVFDTGFTELSNRHRSEAKADRRPPHRTGIGYLLARENRDNPAANDDVSELYGSYLIAHEFGHAFHYASLRPDGLESKDPAKVMAAMFGEDEDDIRATIDVFKQDRLNFFPNEEPGEADKAAYLWLWKEFHDRAGKDQGHELSRQFGRDGLDVNEFLSLKRDGEVISRYGQSDPVEAIAERFAVEHLLGDYQIITGSRRASMDKILKEMDKRKSANSKNGGKPLPWVSLPKGDTPDVTEIIPFDTCEGFNRK